MRAEGRADQFQENGVVYYQNGATNKKGVIILGKRVDDKHYEILAYKHPHNKPGFWTEGFVDDSFMTWNAEQNLQAAWEHEDADAIWAEYIAWKLLKGERQ